MCPLTASNTSRADELFRVLTKGEPVKPIELETQGRAVKVRFRAHHTSSHSMCLRVYVPLAMHMLMVGVTIIVICCSHHEYDSWLKELVRRNLGVMNGNFFHIAMSHLLWHMCITLLYISC